MSMHVESKKMAILGALAGMCVLFICLGSILESNTLFLLGAASFCFGAAVKEMGYRLGVAFLVATFALSFLLAGNKLYCLTYLGMCVYIIIRTLLLKSRIKRMIRKAACFVLFNIMYIPVIIFVPKLIFSGTFSPLLIVLFLVGGQAVLAVYNYVLDWFFNIGWSQIKKRIGV